MSTLVSACKCNAKFPFSVVAFCRRSGDYSGVLHPLGNTFPGSLAKAFEVWPTANDPVLGVVPCCALGLGKTISGDY